MNFFQLHRRGNEGVPRIKQLFVAETSGGRVDGSELETDTREAPRRDLIRLWFYVEGTAAKFPRAGANYLQTLPNYIVAVSLNGVGRTVGNLVVDTSR